MIEVMVVQNKTTNEDGVLLLTEPFLGVVIKFGEVSLSEQKNADGEMMLKVDYDYQVLDWGEKEQGVDFTQKELEDSLHKILNQFLVEQAKVQQVEAEAKPEKSLIARV